MRSARGSSGILPSTAFRSGARANATFGDAIHAEVAKPGSNEKPVLLMGHRDTVFGKGEAGRRPFTIRGQAAPMDPALPT